MLLLNITSFEFVQFLKIVMWVCVPMMILSMLIVTYWHYRNKRKTALSESQTDASEIPGELYLSKILTEKKDEPLFRNYKHILNKPERSLAINSELNKGSHFYSSTPNGSKVMENTSNINLHEQVKKYELKIAQLNQAIEFMEVNSNNPEANKLVREKGLEIQRLQSVIEQLQKELYLLDQQNSSKANEVQKLEHKVKELQESAKLATTDARDVHLNYHQEIENKEKEFFDEKDRLTEQLRSLHEVQKKLEDENKQLLEKVQQNRFSDAPTADHRVEELQAQLARAQEELQSNRSNSPDVNYLQDLLREKSLHIDFLQNQLDHRIRSFHQVEQQVYDLQHSINLHKEELKQRIEKEKDFHLSIQQKEENLQQLQMQFGQHVEEREQLLKSHSETQNRLNEWEQSALEWNRQRELLQQEVEQHKNLLDELHPQLEKTLEQVRFLEDTIERKQSLLSNLHQQLKLAIEADEANKKIQEAIEEYP